jgi:uncharacterized protein YndB with AHSA1/START domain
MTSLTHEFSFDYAVTPERLFQALTSTEDLTVWFAANIEIQPRPDGHFAFWGKHTYGAPSHPGIQSTLHLFEPEQSIGFKWTLEGQASEVRLSVGTSEKGAKLSVRHHFDTAPSIGRVEALIDDLWRLHFGALCAHLQGHPVNLPDFADPHPIVRETIYIDAPRAAVWKGLTDPACLDQWFTKAAQVDLEKRVFDFGWSYEVDGKTVTVPPIQLHEVIENERLVMQWPDWRGDPEVPDQRVIWALSDEGHGTRLTLTQEGFVRPTDVSDYPFGWLEAVTKLKGVSEALTSPAQ